MFFDLGGKNMEGGSYDSISKNCLNGITIGESMHLRKLQCTFYQNSLTDFFGRKKESAKLTSILELLIYIKYKRS